MSVTLTGTGGLFTRLGKILAALNALNGWRGTGVKTISTWTGNGTTATVTTFQNHGYTTGDVVTVQGASSPAVNTTGNTITVTGNTTFTYSSSFNGTPTTPGTVFKTSGAGWYGFGPYIDNIAGQFNSTDQNLITALYQNRDNYRLVHSTLTSYFQSLAQSILIQQVNEDTPLSSQTVTAALTVLISQMTTNATSVSKPTVSTSVAVGGSNVGNGALISSALGPNGLQRDYAIAESLSLICVSDAQGSATAGQELFTLTSPAARSDQFQWDWPLGSGASLSFTAVDATQSNSGGNVLQNSAWGTFSNSNAPDNWPITVGTAGTQILQATGGNVYKGSSGLSFAGDGATLTTIWQPFKTTPSTALGAGGTSYILQPSTVYALNIATKVSAAPAAGVLEIALVNGSGTIQQDAAGNNCSFTVTLTSSGTSFALNNAIIRTPAALPSQAYLRVRLSTALSSGKTAYIGHLAMTPAVQAYPGGPYVGLFSGVTNFLKNDTFTVTVNNNYSSLWALGLDRLFGLKSLGLAIPSSGSPTAADSLIA